MKDESPEKLLADFIDKYNPEIGVLARAALAKMRTLLPRAVLDLTGGDEPDQAGHTGIGL